MSHTRELAKVDNIQNPTLHEVDTKLNNFIKHSSLHKTMGTRKSQNSARRTERHGVCSAICREVRAEHEHVRTLSPLLLNALPYFATAGRELSSRQYEILATYLSLGPPWIQRQSAYFPHKHSEATESRSNEYTTCEL